MLPSALRTLSVLTLLSAVSGSVILTRSSPETADASTTAGTSTTAGAAFRPSTIARPTLDRASRSDARTLLDGGQRADDLAQQIADAKAERIRTRQAEEKKARDRKEREEREEREAAADRVRRNARSNPQAAAKLLLAGRGWSGQYSCLNSLWTKESNWNYRAANPSSGAYGIPQSLPGSKMASAGSDWRTNPVTQMTWGLDYIGDRYGSPCGAWSHSQSSGWY